MPPEPHADNPEIKSIGAITLSTLGTTATEL